MDRFVTRDAPSTSTFSSHKVPKNNGLPLASPSTNTTRGKGIDGHPMSKTASVPHISQAPAAVLRLLQSNPAALSPNVSGVSRNKTSTVAGNSVDVFTFTGRVAADVPNKQGAPSRLFVRSTEEQENLPAKLAYPTMSHHTKLSIASPARIPTTSASAMIRAIQAQRNEPPAYFDVPAAEQDIRTTEELAAAQRPAPTIRDVMRDVRVYVEVRSGSDNRSQGIKTVIADLGASVNDRLVRNTTHVVFKDGLLSTYQKAKGWGIPVVSILWIEGCRRQVCLLDPAKFVISNVERYEQPELFDKIRKQKSMQPYAEETRRRKPAVSKTAANSAISATASTTATASSNSSGTQASTARISVPRKPKDNLPSIFGDFVKTLQQNGVDNCLHKNSKLMDIIRNSPLPKAKVTAHPTTSPRTRSASSDAVASTHSLNGGSGGVGATARIDTPTRRVTRRSSMQNLSVLSMDQETTPGNETAASSHRSRRQTTVFAAVCEEDVEDASNMDLSQPQPPETLTPIHRSTKAAGAASSQKNVPLLNSVLRRQTMYTPQSMQETLCGGDVNATMSSAVSNTSRRRTLFTPSQSSESVEHRLDRLMSEDDSGSTRKSSDVDVTTTNTPSTPVASSSAIKIPDGTPCTPVFGIAPATIFAEYSRTVAQTPTAFSSTRTPLSNKRRTIFDMSMEMIEQRLQNINRIASARMNRSMSESDAAADEGLPPMAAAVVAAASTETCDASKTMARMTSSTSMRALGPITESNAVAMLTPVEKPKKRKLFAPDALSNFGNFDEQPSTSTTIVQQLVSDMQQNEKSNESKRRRDVELDANGSSATPATTTKKAKLSAKETAPTTKAKPSRPKTSSQLAVNRRRTTLDFASAKSTAKASNIAVAAPAAAIPPSSITGILVSTNMHQEQITYIKEAVQKLGAFQLEQNVTARSTHVVSLEPLRTVNFLRGIVRGLWILRYDWIADSSAAGRWLPEEPYEVRDFSAAVSICRSERQSFGIHYRMNIFAEMPPMLITANCACPNIRELIRLCDGHVTANLDRAKYVISDVAVPTRLAGSMCVKSTWILDSISIAKVKKVHAYVLKMATTEDRRE